MILESVGGALGDLLSSPKIPLNVSNYRMMMTMTDMLKIRMMLKMKKERLMDKEEFSVFSTNT